MKGLFVIRDDLADDFAPVFEAVNDAVAIRSFVQLLGQVDKFSRKDYKLIKVGNVERIEDKIVIQSCFEEIEVENE